jgi:LmbE family N-acetylglucosaminyl deacetylase
MKVLVLAPHPDDESIGCGGAVCLHAQAGDSVAAVFLTSGEKGLPNLARDEAWRIREAEAHEAAEILGIAKLHFLRGADGALAGEVAEIAATLRPILQSEKPNLVYLPHIGEWHPDHKAATPILQRALQGLQMSVQIRAYEIWTPLSEFQHLENIDAVMPRKLEAIRAHRSQLEQLAYSDAIEGLNRYRGAFSCKCRYAEVFQEMNR